MKGRRNIFLGCLMALTGWWAATATANYARIENPVLRDHDTVQRQVEVQFDVSWTNSWRNDESHDAVWVFVKFKAPGSNDWDHAYLSPVRGDHTAAIGSRIDPVTDGMGVFISSTSNISGDAVAYSQVRLLWRYGTNGYAFAGTDTLEVSVHAIEMVYVAEGAFFVGCGGYSGSNPGNFTEGGHGGASIPFAITAETAMLVTNALGYLWGTAHIGNPGELPTAFPKGYAAFYCMKYPITQGQYAGFLNLLTEAQANDRYSESNYGQYRFIVERLGESGNYSYSAAEAPDRACNYLSWADGRAYAAWSGLRPMTEMEYEKACRGPEAPVAQEHAWGTTDRVAPSGLQGDDGSGTEWYLNGNCIWAGTDPGSGPVRVGIFATNVADRVSAGASYWGILDLSGNVWEQTVRVDNDTARLFEGTHGDGTLTQPADWPTTNRQRGSSWSGHNNRLRTSSRAGDTKTGRESNNGFRGVRSAATVVP